MVWRQVNAIVKLKVRTMKRRSSFRCSSLNLLASLLNRSILYRFIFKISEEGLLIFAEIF